MQRYNVAISCAPNPQISASPSPSCPASSGPGPGIAEPLPVSATFDFRDEQNLNLSDVARLDAMVTVVDAVNLLKDYDPGTSSATGA